jgi:hypothetical protein
MALGLVAALACSTAHRSVPGVRAAGSAALWTSNVESSRRFSRVITVGRIIHRHRHRHRRLCRASTAARPLLR